MQKSGNCSYLYGEQTTQEMKDRLMQALDNQTKEQLEILLYKKNRTWHNSKFSQDEQGVSSRRVGH